MYCIIMYSIIMCCIIMYCIIMCCIIMCRRVAQTYKLCVEVTVPECDQTPHLAFAEDVIVKFCPLGTVVFACCYKISKQYFVCDVHDYP